MYAEKHGDEYWLKMSCVLKGHIISSDAIENNARIQIAKKCDLPSNVTAGAILSDENIIFVRTWNGRNNEKAQV